MTSLQTFTPEEVQAILTRARTFLDTEVIPREPELLGRPFQELLPELTRLRERVKSLGLWAPALPKELEGLGMPLVAFARLSEELGRSPLGHYLFNCQAPDIGNMELLLAHGTPEQRARFLLPLARGEIRSCFAMTEPEHAGSNPVVMSTTARREGDEYVIDGHKWFTSSAEGAAFAIVMAVTSPDATTPYLRATQILVPTDTPGFTRVRNISVMGDSGSDYASHAEIRLTGCRVPLSNRLGEEGMGFLLAQERLGPGRIHHCMRWVGICERAFELMCSRAVRREIAPGKPLATRQTIQDWVADSRAEINAARALVLEAAQAVDARGSQGARQEISLIKFFVAGVLQRVLDRAIQVHGALGMTDDLPLAYWYRHERAARIYDGPDEVHRAVVARHELRRFGFSH